MIKSFGDKIARAIWDRKYVRSVSKELDRKAFKKMLMLDVSININDLRVPPNNRLKVLHGEWEGWYQIRINDQFRFRFQWNDGIEKLKIGDWHD